MRKYIDADKVIDYANQEVTAAFYYPQDAQEKRERDEQEYRDKWAFVKQVMIGTPAADVASRWIPVTERLPEESGEYLVTIGSMLYFSWFYKDDDMWSFKHADITAWMPLPEPYKEGAQNV